MEQPNHQQNLVGPVVQKLRVAAGLSQEELAAKLQIAGWDLSRGGLSKIEARLRRVNDAELLVIAKVFKCGVAELYPKKVNDLESVLRQARS